MSKLSAPELYDPVRGKTVYAHTPGCMYDFCLTDKQSYVRNTAGVIFSKKSKVSALMFAPDHSLAYLTLRAGVTGQADPTH
jgi:hypothetical protein